MSAATLTYTGELVIEQCWCGIMHAVPRSLVDEQLRQHNSGVKQRGIYCPLGHTWVFSGRSEAARLREQLNTERDSNRWWRDRASAAERRVAAQKGQATKLRKRLAAGICPCCKRSFVDLARHMAGRHPGYAEAPGNEVPS